MKSKCCKLTICFLGAIQLWVLCFARAIRTAEALIVHQLHFRTVLMKKIGPHRWCEFASLSYIAPLPNKYADVRASPIDPFQTVCWGIVCTLISLTQNLTGLCIVRVFLGITEAGLFPGLGYYISLWYKV